jgi:internalin A
MVDSQALDVARARISRESDALTGHLDLGQLGLTELPAELFGLKHLRRLNLGSGMFGEHEQGEWVEACSQIAPNQLDATLADLSRLPGLSALSVRGAILTSLKGIQSLSTLQSLVCSRTQISDLSPLAELRQLQVLICSRTNVNDLAPLKELQRLQELNCARTPVASLAPRHLLGRQTCGYSAVHGRLLVILPRYPNGRILKNFTAKEPR